MKTQGIVWNLTCIAFSITLLVHKSFSKVTDISFRDQLPLYNTDKVLQLFFLEGPFPFNVPKSAVLKAGALYENFALGHAGLGFRDEDTYETFTLQFYAKNFTGAFFPERGEGLSLSWKNQGAVGFEVADFSLSGWKQALYITEVSGPLFNQFADWLVGGFVKTVQIVQPFSVCSDGQLPGQCLIRATNSYSFVWNSLQVMSILGAHIKKDVPLDLMQTRIILLAKANQSTGAPVEANTEIFAYFITQKTCLRVAFFMTKTLVDFAQSVKNCYLEQTYVHLGNSTYISIKLSPQRILIARSAFKLPDDKVPDPSALSPFDIISLLFLVGICFVGLVSLYLRLSLNRCFNVKGCGRDNSVIFSFDESKFENASLLTQKLLDFSDANIADAEGGK